MRTLEVAGSTVTDLSGVYVVGGASGLPSVGRALRATHGRLYHRSVSPSMSAANGLAIANDDSSSYAAVEDSRGSSPSSVSGRTAQPSGLGTYSLHPGDQCSEHSQE